MNRADIDRICHDYGLAPNRQLGQNFLINDGVIDKLIRLIDPQAASMKRPVRFMSIALDLPI